ncbi:hypothetical protein PFNF135_04849 [Plasmodium falciparum NF135/5.C10]|uniref:Mitochondrial pyruvate carrier n=1 Tax=Plasmodium falciparum NF135/5.C10 TaxID=1036726 RepID=W4IBW0_PLAFA|nr:hypothetical protein PFNF135_04849 [Plasmodium falciparum NF135/5.C10]
MSNVGSFFHNVKRNILSIMLWAPLANWGFIYIYIYIKLLYMYIYNIFNIFFLFL